MSSNFKKPLSLNVGKNNYVFENSWRTVSSDLSVAEGVINRLLDERELLLQTVESLQKEILDSNKLKTIALDMVSVFLTIKLHF